MNEKKARFSLSWQMPEKVSSFVDAQICSTGEWELCASVLGADGRQCEAAFTIAPSQQIHVQGEAIAPLPVFNAESWAGWQRGHALAGVKAQECTSKFAFVSGSLRLFSRSPDVAQEFVCDEDYAVDAEWGSVGRIEGGRILPEQTVVADYAYTEQRVDSIVIDSKGGLALRLGTSHVSMPKPPILADGDIRLANIYVEPRTLCLGEDNIFPVLEIEFPETLHVPQSTAERLLPKTLERLRQGGTLKILAWGDSVTDGGFLSNPATERWQEQFVARLCARYPEAEIELCTEAWGGRNTDVYLAEPPGSVHNYQEKVLAVQPDLIVMEFVNDAGLQLSRLTENYDRFFKDFRNIGAEWILCTPHYIRPDWMALTRQRDIDDDPRYYVDFLRTFSVQKEIALADVSRRYGRLWRQGIAYNTLMMNGINHPNADGMAIFSDSLMEWFV